MKKDKRPTYFNWLLTEHKRGKLKLILTVLGIIQAIYVTPMLIEEYNSGWTPLFPIIMMFIASYGFVIGMALQPFLIYKRLIRLDWWK